MKFKEILKLINGTTLKEYVITHLISKALIGRRWNSGRYCNN